MGALDIQVAERVDGEDFHDEWKEMKIGVRIQKEGERACDP